MPPHLREVGALDPDLGREPTLSWQSCMSYLGKPSSRKSPQLSLLSRQATVLVYFLGSMDWSKLRRRLSTWTMDPRGKSSCDSSMKRTRTAKGSSSTRFEGNIVKLME